MHPIKILLVGIDGGRRELERLLWSDGRHVAWASAAGAIAAVRAENPDVVLCRTEAIRSLQSAFPQLPMFDVAGSEDAAIRVRDRFPPLSELMLSSRRIDLVNAQVEGVKLTQTEVSLLRFFAANQGRLVSLDELQRKVWGHREGVQSRAAVTAIYRLRKKIERDPKQSRHLLASYGQGYRFVGLFPEQRTTTGNLSPPTHTVGRRTETEAILSALRESQFVTLVGAPGVGKSHLAAHVARCAGVWATWWCELSRVRSANDLVDAISRAMKIGFQGGNSSSFQYALANNGPMLLVLDGCDEIAKLVTESAGEWVRRAPELHILATSRMRMGAVDFHVSPLPPEDACTLFLTAARRHQPGYASAPGDLEVIWRLAVALEGVPLALELFAVRAVALGPAELLAAAEEPLTTAGQPLRDAIARSWALLDEDARRCLARCAVFAGEFDLSAIRSVVGGALDAITQLAGLSLIRIRQGADGTHYALFDSIRQFAAERLSFAERRELEVRHAEHYAEGLDIPNCLIAWRRFREEQPRLACRVVRGLLKHYWDFGPVEMLEEFLERSAEVDLPTDLWVTFRCWRGVFRLRSQQQQESGLADYRAAVERAADQPDLLAWALLHYASGLLFAGRTQEALAAARRSDSLCRDDPALESQIAQVLGRTAMALGDPDTAEMQFERAVSAARRCKDPAIEHEALARLTYFWPVEVGADCLQRCLDEGATPPGTQAHLMNILAAVRLAQDRIPEALTLLESSLHIYKRMGVIADAALIRANIGALHAELGRTVQAELAVRESLAIARYGGQRATVALAQTVLGMLCLADGRDEEAGRHLLGARESFGEDRTDVAWTNEGNIAVWKLVCGDVSEAIETLSVVRQKHILPPAPGQFTAYEAVGRALLRDFDAADALLTEAYAALEGHHTGQGFVELCRIFVDTRRGRLTSIQPSDGPFSSDARLILRLLSSPWDAQRSHRPAEG